MTIKNVLTPGKCIWQLVAQIQQITGNKTVQSIQDAQVLNHLFNQMESNGSFEFVQPTGEDEFAARYQRSAEDIMRQGFSYTGAFSADLVTVAQAVFSAMNGLNSYLHSVCRNGRFQTDYALLGITIGIEPYILDVADTNMYVKCAARTGRIIHLANQKLSPLEIMRVGKDVHDAGLLTANSTIDLLLEAYR